MKDCHDDEEGVKIAAALRADLQRIQAEQRRAPSSPKGGSLAVRAVSDHMNGNHVEAAKGYQASYDTEHSHLALYGAALMAYQKGDLMRAARLLAVVTDRAPAFAPGWYNYGLCIQLLGNPTEALDAHNRALRLDPKLVEAYNGKGIALLDLGRHGEAINAFEEACRRPSVSGEARFNRAIALLLTGRFEEGWAAYESRHEVMFLPKPLLPPHMPTWDGSPLAGRKLLLWCEQGLGDSLMMARFFARIEGVVSVIVPASLKRLLAQSCEGVTFYSTGDDFPEADVHASIMSLPYLLKLKAAEIPAEPYLRAA